MAGLLSPRLIGSPAAAESRACPRPPRTGSRRRSVGCYCSSRNDGTPPQVAEDRVRITPCFTNKVYEDRARGIVCYRDGNGEVVCEGLDEGPRPAAPCPARDQEVDVIELLERSWLRLETGTRRSAEYVDGFLN
uniref:Uncharacterized protein n=1 Tax=Kalanchoe fedtschenkoi TaxID=63787 RepID=A0A7N0RIJ4_KALFE